MKSSDKPYSEKESFHLAGIIPIHGMDFKLNLPWHITLQPIAENYTMIENAVVECAAAGCETIWIIASEKTSPLIRRRVGEYILDPSTYFRFRTDLNRKYVSIHYVPVQPIDRDRRDCLAWSTTYGCLAADKVSRHISKWHAPDKFYICYPWGVKNYFEVLENRIAISSPSCRRFTTSYDGKTIADGLPHSFTLTLKEARHYKEKIRKTGTGRWDWSVPRDEWKSDKGPGIPLPKDEAYSARYFTLQDIFSDLDFSAENDYIKDLEWFSDAGTWEGYCDLLGDRENKVIVKPHYALAHYREWNYSSLRIEDFRKDEDYDDK
jgi:hypothetical protein